MPKPKPARSCAPVVLALALLACMGNAQAQFSGGGGRGGGGGMGGGPPGGARGERPAAASAGTRHADERARPELLRVWFDALQQLRPALALQAAQDEAMEALLRDLRDLAELSERRRERALGFGRPPVSALTDIDRDLRLEEEALADHAAAYGDVRRFHQRLQALLSPAQYEAVADSYRKSQQTAAGVSASPTSSTAPAAVGKAAPPKT